MREAASVPGRIGVIVVSAYIVGIAIRAWAMLISMPKNRNIKNICEQNIAYRMHESVTNIPICAKEILAMAFIIGLIFDETLLLLFIFFRKNGSITSVIIAMALPISSAFGLLFNISG